MELDVLDPKNDDELLAKARDRFIEAEEAENTQRELALDDLKFRAGQQWPRDMESARQLDRRPCLTINRLPQFLRQVTNDQRQNRPSIRVSPVDDKGDPETAKVLQGLIRHIEVDSHADIAYDTAFEAAATHGRGYFRLITEYLDETSFDLCIKIKRIRNPFTVYMDPTCQEPDYSDAMWGFIIRALSRDEFRRMYPDTDEGTLDIWASVGDTWVTRDTVRLAEYFYLEREKMTLAMLPDRSVVRQRDIPQGMQPVATRTAYLPVVWWCKINGHAVLEKTRWLGRHIPIIPVLGDELDIDGEVEVSGVVRHAKDPQRMYNYWVSAETETIALAPRAPFIAAEGQLEGYERQWATANVRNHPYLLYKPRSLGGAPLPPPARNTFEPPVQAITQARLMAADDLKATTGIYDAALGARSNETSGRAIRTRQVESDVANFHYMDNLARALRHCGRMLIDLIPQVYDTQRALRIIGEDGEERQVQVNAPYIDERGQQRLYDLTTGRYDVVVHTGPSFTTKRQETVDAMMQLTQAYPPLFQMAGDLLVKNMDWPGAQEISERLKKAVPPELLQSEDGATPEDQLAQMQQAIPQLQQQIEALNAYAQQCEQQGQQMAQENQQLKQGAEAKQAELTLKQQDLQVKAELEAQKLQLEAQKLQLEAQKLDMDAQRMMLEDDRWRDETALVQMAPPEPAAEGDTLRAGKPGGRVAAQVTQMHEALGRVAELLEGAMRLLSHDMAQRHAPKQVVVQRQPDGTLVGAIESPNGTSRHIAVTPTPEGFVGDVGAESDHGVP